MLEDQFEGAYYNEETYSKGLSREDTLESQIRAIAFFYSRMMWSEFEYAIKILLTMLPKEVRVQFKPLEIDTTPAGVEKHYQFFKNMQEKIEADTNMIWKKKFIKTYK